MVTDICLLGVKRPESEADTHLHVLLRLKWWHYATVPFAIFTWSLIKHRDFTFAVFWNKIHCSLLLINSWEDEQLAVSRGLTFMAFLQLRITSCWNKEFLYKRRHNIQQVYKTNFAFINFSGTPLIIWMMPYGQNTSIFKTPLLHLEKSMSYIHSPSIAFESLKCLCHRVKILLTRVENIISMNRQYLNNSGT